MRGTDSPRLPFLPALRPGAHPRLRERVRRVGGDGDRARTKQLMPSATRERETAIAAADATCPRCGASREPDHRYCLDCGLALPSLAGPIPRLRRRWLRRVGWYPGDWVWISLPTLLLAMLGAAAAIAVSEHRESARGNVFTAPVASIAVTEPTVVPTTRAPTGDTSTLPTAPEPRSR